MRNHEVAHPLHTQALLESLLSAPLLVGDLESSTFFDRRLFGSIAYNSEGLKLNYSQKLGHLYEDALSYLLENANGEIPIDVMGVSLQVFNDNKITQGELDYLLKIGEKIVHLELAVKFYLIYEQGGKTTFPGPDPRDDWDSKLSRMENHQLKIASSEHGKKYLLDEYGVENVEVNHLIYGKIFDHLSKINSRESKLLPRSVCDQTMTYPWLYISQWDEYLEANQARFIPKHLWPASTNQYKKALLDTLPVVQKNEYVASMADHQSCLMVWSARYRCPVFLVPDHWPSIL